MRSTFSLILLLFIIDPFTSLACDICSSGGTSAMQGVLPNFDRNMAGISYQFNSFTHPSTALNMNGSSRVLKDQFHIQQFRMRWYKGPRFQTQIALPYQNHIRTESSGKHGIGGLGDPELRMGYILVNTQNDSIIKPWKHLLMAGTQIRLPSGKYQQRTPERLMYPSNFQIGTGAWSYGMHAMYSIRKGAWGLNTQLQAQWTMENELSYQRGSTYGASMFAFYWKKWNNWSVLPSVSVGIESMQRDQSFAVAVENTGGTFFQSGFGIEAFYNEWNFSTYIQKPMIQYLDEAQPEADLRLSIGISKFL